MKIFTNSQGIEEIRFLTQSDLDILIYMNSDIWITPEIKRFKNEILNRLGEIDH